MKKWQQVLKQIRANDLDEILSQAYIVVKNNSSYDFLRKALMAVSDGQVDAVVVPFQDGSEEVWCTYYSNDLCLDQVSPEGDICGALFAEYLPLEEQAARGARSIMRTLKLHNVA
jgi:hypothetical protein